MPHRIATCLAIGWMVLGSATAYADYRTTALGLNPTHYYGLDETTTGTVSDLGSVVINGTHEGPFPPAVAGVAGPDLPGMHLGNLALGNNDAGGVNLGTQNNFAADVMSIAMWVKSGAVNTGDRLFTNNLVRSGGSTVDSFQVVLGGFLAGLVVATGQDPDMQLHLSELVYPVKNNAWHHVVVVRNGDDVNNAIVVIDGVDYTSQLTPTDTTWGTDGTNAHLGARVDGAGAGNPYTFNGTMDEVGIWMNRALTVAEAQALYQSALVPEPSTATLGLLALAGVARMARRRRASSTCRTH